MKSIIISLGILFLLSSCGDDTSIESCEYRLETSVDKASTEAEYEAVITLADGDCKTTMVNAGKSEDLAMYKAGAYLGKSGISIAGLTSTLLSGGDIMTALVAKFSGADAALNISEAITEYEKVTTADKNCTLAQTSTLTTQNRLNTCIILGYVKPIMATAGISTLTGPSVTYNGQEVSSMTALLDPTSIGIVSGTATEFDVDANGTMDSSQATGEILSGNGVDDTAHTTLSFVSGGTTYTYDHKTITITSSDAAFSDYKGYFLLTTGTSINIVTSGYCSLTMVTCSTRNDTDCFVCPVINSSGDALTSTTVVVDMLDSVDANDTSNPLASVKSSIDSDSNGTISDAELAAYMAASN